MLIIVSIFFYEEVVEQVRDRRGDRFVFRFIWFSVGNCVDKTVDSSLEDFFNRALLSSRSVYVFQKNLQIRKRSVLTPCCLLPYQGFDSASTDTGTGQDGDKEDGDDTEEKDENPPEDR